jgi:hypothetical protein
MGFLPALAAVGTAAGGIGSLISSFTGGGGGSSSGGGGSGSDYFSQYGALAAAMNNPLTAAINGLAILQGSLGGALGLEGSTIANSQLGILKEALNRAEKATTSQAAVTTGAAGAGIDTLKNLANARTATELAGPQFLGQAGSASLAGENELARTLASTNLGLRQLQEATRSAVAQKQADTLADVFSTRAKTEGSLALGAQALESGLKLQQAKTLSDLANIQGQTKAQLAMKRYGASQALAGTRFFA